MSADEIRYEKTDAHAGPIVKYTIYLLVFTAICAGLSWGVIHGFREFFSKGDPPRPAMAVDDPARLPMEPRLHVRPTVDVSEMKLDERELLNTYGWTDQSKGVVRIPVARAMQLLAQRGLPTRGAAPAVTPSPAPAEEKP
jgi:hypothetical protein